MDRIIKVLDGTSFSWEIIFIEDASTDTTANLIKSYIKKNPRKHLSAYFHEKNLGRGKSVSEGVERSQGKVVGYIDIDCEIPPNISPVLSKALIQVTTLFRDGEYMILRLKVYRVGLQAKVMVWLETQCWERYLKILKQDINFSEEIKYCLSGQRL